MRRMPRRPRRLINVPAAVAEIADSPAKGKVIEVWLQDEARIGQKPRSRAVGQSADEGHPHRTTRAPARAISSVPSAPNTASRSSRNAMARSPCHEPASDRDFPKRCRRCAPHPRHGSCRMAQVKQPSWSPQTSPFCLCCRNRPNSIPSKTGRSSVALIGCTPPETFERPLGPPPSLSTEASSKPSPGPCALCPLRTAFLVLRVSRARSGWHHLGMTLCMMPSS